MGCGASAPKEPPRSPDYLAPKRAPEDAEEEAKGERPPNVQTEETPYRDAKTIRQMSEDSPQNSEVWTRMPTTRDSTSHMLLPEISPAKGGIVLPSASSPDLMGGMSSFAEDEGEDGEDDEARDMMPGISSFKKKKQTDVWTRMPNARESASVTTAMKSGGSAKEEKEELLLASQRRSVEELLADGLAEEDWEQGEEDMSSVPPSFKQKEKVEKIEEE